MKYSHFNISKEDILKTLKDSQKPLDFIQIAQKLKISRKFNSDLSRLIFDLCDEHKIEKTKDGLYFFLNYIEGGEYKISVTSKRLGFIDFNEQNSALLLPFEINNVLDGDVVLADIYSYTQNDRDLYRAYIKKVISHTKNVVIGSFVKGTNNNLMYFEAVDDRDSARYIINVPEHFEYDTKQFVKAKVLKPHKQGRKIDVEFLEYLGSSDTKGIVEKKIIAQNDVDIDFDSETLKQAKTLPTEVNESDYKGRQDLSDLFTVTIDGDDTKDFDDAISCKKTENGYKLWVHIADVSYYVTEDSAIDKEALERGTSIYLPDRVIPMLPFELSNGICSLNPDALRTAMTLELDLDSKGLNTSYKVYPSIIKSNYRLTYSKVNDFYDNKHTFDTETSQMLTVAKEISKLIRKNKINEGYVDFEITEPKIILNDEGDVVDIKVKETGFSEAMIEDFMVRANETVATMMKDKKIPSIYRIHEKPSEEKILNLQQVLNFLKIDAKVPTNGDSKKFANMVNKIKEVNFDNFIKAYLLRTLQKAKYSEKNIGHFGLASECYSHFTSPIRRYPDLLLHRLIRQNVFTNKELTDDQKEALNLKIHRIAELNSESENTALSVERGVLDVKKAEFFNNFIGKTFEATMISAEKFGIFFELEQYMTSILVRFDDIQSEQVIQVSNLEAKGPSLDFKSGKKYKIKITETDAMKGTVSAVLA